MPVRARDHHVLHIRRTLADDAGTQRPDTHKCAGAELEVLGDAPVEHEAQFGVRFVHEAQGVAGAVVAIGVEGLGRELRRAPVAGCHVRPPETRFQLAVDRYQSGLAARRRNADVACLDDRSRAKGAGRRGFGHAEAGHDADRLAAAFDGHIVKVLPGGLRQPGPGAKEQLYAREENLGEFVVGFQRLGQHLPRNRNVEVHRGRDLAQIAQGRGEIARGRAAVVEIERAAVVEHDSDVVAAAEGVVPRQPVDQHWRLLLEERESLQQHLLVTAEHAVCGDDRLRLLGRARREQEFGNRRWTHLIIASVDVGGRGGEQTGEGCGGAPRYLALCQDQFGVKRQQGLDGPCKQGAIAGKHRARRQLFDQVEQLGRVGRHQRVGRRER